jgi:hypothetical protein
VAIVGLKNDLFFCVINWSDSNHQSNTSARLLHVALYIRHTHSYTHVFGHLHSVFFHCTAALLYGGLWPAQEGKEDKISGDKQTITSDRRNCDSKALTDVLGNINFQLPSDLYPGFLLQHHQTRELLITFYLSVHHLTVHCS